MAAWLELPLGSRCVTLDGQVDYRVIGSTASHRAAALSSNLAELGVSIRLPGGRAA